MHRKAENLRRPYRTQATTERARAGARLESVSALKIIIWNVYRSVFTVNMPANTHCTHARDEYEITNTQKRSKKKE